MGGAPGPGGAVLSRTLSLPAGSGLVLERDINLSNHTNNYVLQL